MLSKKTFIIISILSMLFVLVSCGSGSSSGAQSSSTNGNSSDLWSDVEINQATELALGTMALDGTDNAVTPDQASTLITLWEAYTALAYDDTTAQAELDAVISGISAAMTDDQLAAIDAMHITAESIPAILETAMGDRMQPRTTGTPGINGLDPSMMDNSGMPNFDSGDMPNFDPGNMPSGGGSAGGFSGGPGGAGGGDFQGMGGAMGGGDMGSVMGNPNGESTIDPSMQATRQAMAQTQMMNTQVFNMVIQYLRQLDAPAR
jgi:hypothetical protein